MAPTPSTLQNLLTAVKQVADHQKEIRRLKGENFNLFSILGMETAENKTHSAFLGELLNPHGSHGMGDEFLGLFLEEVGYKGPLAVVTAGVVLEKFIGPRDDQNKTGGRIDIYVSDKAGKTLSIENKIYAVDQTAQIERYAKHNSKSNTVYYLTLEGSEPTDGSKGELKAGEGYHCISYRHHIVEWLGKCMRHSVDFPILRESIKQYMILIQKLTGQLTDTTMAKEIHDLIVANYTAAKLIEQNLVQVEEQRATAFLKLVKQKLDSMLLADSNWVVNIWPDLTKDHARIEIQNKTWNGVSIILKAYRLLMRDPWYLGIIAWDKEYDRADFKRRLFPVLENQTRRFKLNEWGYFREFETLNMKRDRSPLFDNQLFESYSTEIATEMVEMARSSEPVLEGIVKISDRGGAEVLEAPLE
jgi:hypothetical protein